MEPNYGPPPAIQEGLQAASEPLASPEEREAFQKALREVTGKREPGQKPEARPQAGARRKGCSMGPMEMSESRRQGYEVAKREFSLELEHLRARIAEMKGQEELLYAKLLACAKLRDASASEAREETDYLVESEKNERARADLFEAFLRKQGLMLVFEEWARVEKTRASETDF